MQRKKYRKKHKKVKEKCLQKVAISNKNRGEIYVKYGDRIEVKDKAE